MEVEKMKKFNDGMYRVVCYNEMDAEFGYDCGAQIIFNFVDKAQAKSYVRHMNKEMRKLNVPVYYDTKEINNFKR